MLNLLSLHHAHTIQAILHCYGLHHITYFSYLPSLANLESISFDQVCCNTIPLQVIPSPINPGIHTHLYDPIEL